MKVSAKPVPPAKKPRRAAGRRSKAQARADMLEKILDAAEELFSRNGLHGVTLRDVAARVGVHTTLLNYYFVDKDKLFEAVYARKAGTTIEVRMKALERYEAEAGGRPTVEGALRAFLDSNLDLYMQGGKRWMNYATFLARFSNTSEGSALMDRHFDPVVLKLIAILKRALPGYPEEDLFWGYNFVTGALMNSLARTKRIHRLSGGVCDPDDFGAVKQRLAKFMAAGFLALKK